MPSRLDDLKAKQRARQRKPKGWGAPPVRTAVADQRRPCKRAPICLRTFVPVREHQVYCSDNCRVQDWKSRHGLTAGGYLPTPNAPALADVERGILQRRRKRRAVS